MKLTVKSTWRRLIMVTIIVAWTGSLSGGQVARVASMMGKKRTLCVGRLLIDVPGQANTRFSGAMMDGFTIATMDETTTAFAQRLAARENELGARKPATDGTGGIVEAFDVRAPGVIGRVLVYGRNRGYLMRGDRRIDDEFVSVEAHAHTDGVSFTLALEYGDDASAELAQGLLARLQVRDNDAVPSTPGFCIERAIFTDPLPLHTTEHITLHLGLSGHPDMGLALSSMPGGGTTDSLLARFAATDAEASIDEMLRVTALRSHKRRINGIAGEEHLERVRELNFTTGYNFMWESPGVEGDLQRPFLLLNMESGTNPRAGGEPVVSSLREDAMLAMWDGISSSIRVRGPDHQSALDGRHLASPGSGSIAKLVPTLP